MSHRKISKGARAALLARFAPDGYVLVTVLDQTIGYLVDGDWATIVHREATIYPTHEAAGAARAAYLVSWREGLVEYVEDETKSAELRAYWRTLIVAIDADDGTGDPFSKAAVDPWIEPVQVAAHFCDRPDTW